MKSLWQLILTPSLPIFQTSFRLLCVLALMINMSTQHISVQEEEDIVFLKNQVHRLSAVLSQYQKKNLPLSEGEYDKETTALSSESPQAPWLTNKQLLCPLLVEYDHTIAELNSQLSTYRTELSLLSSQVQEVTEENTKLHSELRKNMESHLKTAPATSNSLSHSGAEGNVMVEALQRQTDVLSQERDSYIDLLRQASKNLEAVQKSERGKTESLHKCKAELITAQQAASITQQTLEELQSTSQRLDEELGHCLKTVQMQEKELTTLQSQLSQTKTALTAANIKNDDLKQSLDEITLHLKKRQSECQEINSQQQSKNDRIHHFQMHITDLEAKLLISQREATILKAENNDIEEAYKNAQSKINSLEQREYEAVLHVKESIQISEDALMEKEQALVNKQQMDQEISRLKETIAVLLREASEKTRNDVAMVREEYNVNIDKMAVEIHKLEQESAERQAKCERAQRDKRAVEKELDKLSKYTPHGSAQRGKVSHELQSKACTAERARDTALMKLETAQSIIEHLETKLAEEKKATDQMIQDNRKSQKNVQKEIQLFQQQKVNLISENRDLQQKLIQYKHAREAIEIKLIKETSELKQRHNIAEKRLICQLESKEEIHQRAIQEQRELMAAQHRVEIKWREETKCLTRKFEQTLSNLKAELLKHKQQSEELNVRFHQIQFEKTNLTKQLKMSLTSNKTLKQKLSETEAQTEVSSIQLATLLQERWQLQQQLDNIKIKMNKIRQEDLPASVPMGLSSRIGQAELSNSRPDFTTRGTPSHPHSYRQTTPVPHGLHLDSSHWDTALTDLKRSIRQVRHDLGLKPEHSQNGFSANGHMMSEHSFEQLDSHEDYSELSQSAVLAKSDLTPSHANHVEL